jgi:POT family proton-dependent oligopeptide transporter
MNQPTSAPSPASAPASNSASGGADPNDRVFFGHPAGLLTLFFAEMWERFSYYGMRAILILFMTAATSQQAQEMIAAGQATVVSEVGGQVTAIRVAEPDKSQKEVAVGGLGFSKTTSGVIYALYTSMVYFAGLAGGWLADNVIGQRRAVFWGGVVIMLGHISLAFHGLPFFFGGLVLIIVGTGLLKPNISTIVGLLYGSADVRRDSGFAIYYMGINVGSFFGQTVCGFFAQHPWFKANVLAPMGIESTASWHWGFAAAAVGMFFGLVVFVWKGGLMRGAGLHPNPPANAQDAQRRKDILIYTTVGIAVVAALVGWWLHSQDELNEKVIDRINLSFGAVLLAITAISFGRIIFVTAQTAEERKRLTVVLILFLASVLFWGAFEQAGGSLNLFADEKSADKILGMPFPSSWYQNINPFGIMVLSPLFAYAWLKLGTRAPSSPVKFSIGLILVGVGFIVGALGAQAFDHGGGQRISPLWLTGLYASHTMGELFLSPIGLSMVTKLAPQRAVSQVMSIWFLANADANFIAGQTVVLNDKFKLSDAQVFTTIAVVTIAAGILLALMAKPIKRMMGGVH